MGWWGQGEFSKTATFLQLFLDHLLNTKEVMICADPFQLFLFYFSCSQSGWCCLRGEVFAIFWIVMTPRRIPRARTGLLSERAALLEACGSVTTSLLQAFYKPSTSRVEGEGSRGRETINSRQLANLQIGTIWYNHGDICRHILIWNFAYRNISNDNVREEHQHWETFYTDTKFFNETQKPSLAKGENGFSFSNVGWGKGSLAR